MQYLVLLAIFVIANDAFYLIPAYHVKGVFNITDIGNLLIWSSLLLMFIKSRHRNIVLNPVGIMILLYLLMVLMHASIASFNYNQSVVSGLIKGRHQFYYLSYFVFLLALDTDEKVERFMKYLSWTAIFIVAVSAVNYAGITVFHEHKWAEGHGVRSGIKRAFIPGMNILALLFTWHFTKILAKKKFNNRDGWSWIVIVVGMLFRQTRGRTIAATAAMCWAMFRDKQYKMLGILVLVGSVFGAILSVTMEENLLFKSYESAVTDVIHQEGTWVGRMHTIENAWAEFKKYPITGSGALVIRQDSNAALSEDVLRAAYQADLGYAHWVKNFGLLGIIWLLLITYLLMKEVIKRRKLFPDDIVNRFCEYHFVHLVVGTITINYLVKPEGIVVICLIAALGTRLLNKQVKNNIDYSALKKGLLSTRRENTLDSKMVEKSK